MILFADCELLTEITPIIMWDPVLGFTNNKNCSYGTKSAATSTSCRIRSDRQTTSADNWIDEDATNTAHIIYIHRSLKMKAYFPGNDSVPILI